MSEFRTLFERCGWSIPEAADRLGYSEGSVYRWLRDEVQPKSVILDVLRTELDRRAETDASAHFRFIDLFAGIGGLRIGFESIGGKCVLTSEWDRFAQETYRKNFLDGPDHVLAGDIREVTRSPETLDQIPEHDVLLAGFPCQPFSIAGVSKKNALGRPHGFLCDTQGTLFFDLAQIIRHHRPKAFLLENVKNLERHDGGRTFATIQQVLREELGYETVTHRVISSEPWVPQRRERVFIVGFRDDCRFSFDDVVIPDTPHPTLGSVLETEVPEKYTLTPKLWDYLQRYKEKHAAKGNGFGCSVFGPGDVFMVPEGTVCSWKTTGYVRKFYCMLDTSEE